MTLEEVEKRVDNDNITFWEVVAITKWFEDTTKDRERVLAKFENRVRAWHKQVMEK